MRPGGESMPRNVSYISHEGISGDRERNRADTYRRGGEPFRARGAHRKSHQCAIKSARVTARRRIVSALLPYHDYSALSKEPHRHATHTCVREMCAYLPAFPQRASELSPEALPSLSHFYSETSLSPLPSRKRDNCLPNLALCKTIPITIKTGRKILQ